jgi:hypothetical protein
MPRKLITEILTAPPASLTNQQWAAISEYSHLPDEARPQVERAVGLYHLSNIGGSPAQIRKQLFDLKARVSTVRTQLIETSRSSRGVVALALGLRNQLGKVIPATARTNAQRVIEELTGLEEWLGAAAQCDRYL